MADGNQAYPTNQPHQEMQRQNEQPPLFLPQGVGQNKAPTPASNGPFQPSGAFHTGAHWRPLTALPQSSPNMNGFPAQHLQQSRMPITNPAPQPPPHVYQTPNLQQRPPGQVSYPPPSVQPAGSFMNGPGNTNIRPSATSNFPPSVGFAPPPRAGYGMAPPQSGNQAVGSPQPPPPSQSLGQPPSSLPYSVGVQGSAGDGQQSRPNELPMPFHGQGQYSHQVNPLQQRTPITTPTNSEPSSERSSRGPSPVSGSTIDALEGQFSPGHGVAKSPTSSQGPRMPPVATGTFSPPLQGHLPAQSMGQPVFLPPPPRPGFPLIPPQSALPPSQQQLPGQLGQRLPPPPTSGFSPMGQPSGPPGAQPRFSHPPLPSTARGFPPPPSSSTVPNAFPPPSVPPFAPPPSSGSVSPPMAGAGTGSLPPPLRGSMPGTQPPLPPLPGSQYSSMPPAGLPPSYQYGQPGPQQPGVGMNAVTQNLGAMGIQESQRVVNLLTERQLIPPEGIETAKPVLPNDLKKVNCNPDVFRCTLNALPQNSALLSKARLPLGILIHPFRDLSQLPVIQSSVIVRCRSCRTYINPFVVFVDQRRWKCNLCFRVNDLPDEFSFDPVTKTYGDPQRRPEVKSATIEFIAPSEYMLRPPQPAVYLYLLDVSFNAVETGYLSQFSQILLDELDKLPGDARTSIGFLCYDSSLYFFNLAENLSQPQMLCVPDLEDAFLPCPDNLLVNLHESKELIVDLLNQLPNLFQGNLETGSALGAALQAAHKLMSLTGGRITVMQTCLPTAGPGALQNRDAGNIAGKNTSIIGPATDFYKKLSLDCSAQQIAVDLFMLNGQYADIATLSCISKYSAGSVYYYPSFHTVKNPGLVDKFDTDLRRYLTRKIGFESVMRIRCTRGLSIHTFHGNFFVRSTDLLSLPNINPDAGFGMQMSIEDNLVDSSTVSFQAALLYTSSKGERRIRVHTLCVPVTNQISEVFAGADQQAIIALLAKMAVDKSLNSSITDARDAMMNASLDALVSFSQQIPASQRVGAFLAPYSLRLVPVFILAMLKHVAFNLSGNTKIDDRVFAMQQCKVLPVSYLLQYLHPHLYPLHRLSDEKPIKCGKEEIPSAPLLQLSSANIDRTGLFLMDAGEAMYLLVGSGIGDQMCQDVFGKPNFMSVPEGMMDLPELENPTSERIRNFVNYLMDSRPYGVTFLVIRDDSKHRQLFFQHMLEDRAENSMSYYEFLQFLQGKTKV
ncbi:unnamed protein product [Candidula unifasciata]|uniref:Uncharacterized protein n=1 Tax=Candidula unifasciata TaxID=100452 RepID=A0A8S3YXV6_9EUPU|nr:unnamed protein product [Candidula unifasciata]